MPSVKDLVCVHHCAVCRATDKNVTLALQKKGFFCSVFSAIKYYSFSCLKLLLVIVDANN